MKRVLNGGVIALAFREAVLNRETVQVTPKIAMSCKDLSKVVISREVVIVKSQADGREKRVGQSASGTLFPLSLPALGGSLFKNFSQV